MRPFLLRPVLLALPAAAVAADGPDRRIAVTIDGEPAPARLRMLHDWPDAGAELGNHTYGRTDLHAAGLAACQADMLKGERQL